MFHNILSLMTIDINALFVADRLETRWWSQRTAVLRDFLGKKLRKMAGNKELIIDPVAEALCSHVWSALYEGILPHPLSCGMVKLLVVNRMSFVLPLLVRRECSFICEEVIAIISQTSH